MHGACMARPRSSSQSYSLCSVTMTRFERGRLVAVLLLLLLTHGVESFTRPAAATRATITMMAGESKYLSSNKPVFVAGGSRGLGLEVIKQLVSRGNLVHALVRRQESVDMLRRMSPLVTPTLGDAMDEAAVQGCMQGCIAAVTTLGGKPDIEGAARVDYVGNSNVVEQAGILGCERIVLVTSLGCGKTRGAISDQVYAVLKDALIAKDKAERDLRTYTNLDWTIIRPGGLKSDPATGSAILTDDIMAAGVVNRADVATMVIKCLGSEGKSTRRELTCIDPTQNNDYATIGAMYVPFTV